MLWICMRVCVFPFRETSQQPTVHTPIWASETSHPSGGLNPESAGGKSSRRALLRCEAITAGVIHTRIYSAITPAKSNLLYTHVTETLQSMPSLVTDSWKQGTETRPLLCLRACFCVHVSSSMLSLEKHVARFWHASKCCNTTQSVAKSCFVSSQIWTLCDTDNIETKNNFMLSYSGSFLWL